MSTSGSNNFTQTLNEIIYDAYQTIGVYGLGRTISSEDYNYAKNTINRMIKSWATQGLHLWTKEENTLFLTENVGVYNLNNSANAANINDIIDMELLIAVDSDPDTQNLTVADTTGMSINDPIFIEMSNGLIHSTTITLVASSNVITVAIGVTASANVGAHIYVLPTKTTKPLKILSCRRISGFDHGDLSTETEVSMAALSYDEYMNLPNKTNSGVPSQYMYNPRLNDGMLYIWQRPSNSEYRINFTSERKIEDLDSAGDNFDFPPEWLEPIMWQLALRLCPAFGKDQKMVNSILPMAQSMLQNLLDSDSEVTSVMFQPDSDY